MRDHACLRVCKLITDDGLVCMDGARAHSLLYKGNAADGAGPHRRQVKLKDAPPYLSYISFSELALIDRSARDHIAAECKIQWVWWSSLVV